MYLLKVETPEKGAFVLQAMPGFSQFSSVSGVVRGSVVAAGRALCVAGSSLLEILGNGNTVSRGTLLTTSGRVGMEWGRDQVMIVDGPNGYVFRLSTNVFTTVSDADFPGSNQVSELDGFFITHTPGTDQFNISAVDDGLTWDALDFASAESRPDNIVAHIVINREAMFLGETTIEWWYVSGGDGFALSRRTVSAVGCISPWSVARADNTVLMIGRDEHGSGLVYQIAGYQARRVSTFALEAQLQKSTDLSATVAFVFQWHGETFYALQVPGLNTTPVYQLSTGTWLDLADLGENGLFVPYRATDHLFAYGMHMMLSADSRVWVLSDSVHTYGRDPRVCERTSPHNASRSRDLVRYSEFVADVTTGEAVVPGATVYAELSWSNDGGRSFCDPVPRPLGEIGERVDPPRWRRLGMARDRVWRLRYSGNGPFAIMDAQAT